MYIEKSIRIAMNYAIMLGARAHAHTCAHSLTSTSRHLQRAELFGAHLLWFGRRDLLRECVRATAHHFAHSSGANSEIMILFYDLFHVNPIQYTTNSVSFCCDCLHAKKKPSEVRRRRKYNKRRELLTGVPNMLMMINKLMSVGLRYLCGSLKCCGFGVFFSSSLDVVIFFCCRLENSWLNANSEGKRC